MKKCGLDIPSGATVLRFDTYGQALVFERTLRSQGYIRPAHGRHLQGLKHGKYVLFDHSNSYWIGFMGRPKTHQKNSCNHPSTLPFTRVETKEEVKR